MPRLSGAANGHQPAQAPRAPDVALTRGGAAPAAAPARGQPQVYSRSAPQTHGQPHAPQAPLMGDDLSTRVQRAAQSREAAAAASRVRAHEQQPDAAPSQGHHAHTGASGQGSAPQTAQNGHQQPGTGAEHAAIPVDFGLDKEHPMLRIPFSLQIEGRRYEGVSMSITQLVARGEDLRALPQGKRAVAWLQIAFDGFSVLLQPEIVSAGAQEDGTVVLQFTDPTGPHVPQLRYVMNSYIAGDVVSMGGILSYTGPDKPAIPKQSAGQQKKSRSRSMGVMLMSALCAVLAAFIVYTRYTTGHEMHPVFVERAGQKMRATVAGQVAYVNPNAVRGDVLYAVNGNTGDVLNFMMPCDCGVALQPGVAEGTTVLPTDLIATVYQPDAPIRLQSLISVDGLARAMGGANVWLDLDNGKSVAVQVVPGEATRTAVLGGEVFVPVDLQTEPGALTEADIGRSARLRMTPNLTARLGLE